LNTAPHVFDASSCSTFETRNRVFIFLTEFDCHVVIVKIRIDDERLERSERREDRFDSVDKIDF
jgi:hypothetical protein